MADHLQRLLYCERCGNKFSVDERPPVILPNCGHTFCEFCVSEILTIAALPERVCPIETCGTEITFDGIEKFCKNQQVMNLLEKIGDEEFTDNPGSLKNVPCPRHPDKHIEYFCKQCAGVVCVKCIFDEHNGHDLVQIEEMANSLRQNVIDLQKMIINASRLNEENSKLLDQTKDELNRLKFQQIKNIDRGFNELIRKLEEKRMELKNEFEKRYRGEEQKLLTKMSLVASSFEEVSNIEKIFDELMQFIDTNADAKILQKATEMTTFLHKSFTDLDIITKNQISQKAEIYISPNLRPLTLNVRKALDIVHKFQMVPPAGPAMPAFRMAQGEFRVEARPPSGIAKQTMDLPPLAAGRTKVQSLTELGINRAPQRNSFEPPVGLRTPQSKNSQLPMSSHKRFQPAQSNNSFMNQSPSMPNLTNPNREVITGVGGNSMMEQFSHKQGSMGSNKGPATAKNYLSGNEDMDNRPVGGLQEAAANRRRQATAGPGKPSEQFTI